MQDYAKFDVRLDASGRYYFIDSNANPAFGPKELNTSMGLIIQELYGVPFSEILRRLINNTLGVNSESGINANGDTSETPSPTE
jgi:D-alanine-D-alanine ligase-like ATP-grasp enzyme